MLDLQIEMTSDSCFIVFVGIILIVVLGAFFLSFLIDFLLELRYLNKEIACTHGEERAYWIRQRRRLWLSLLPFIKY